MNFTINSEIQFQLSNTPKWKTFQQKYGTSYVLWNEKTKTPHRAFGKAIPIEGFSLLTESNVETAALAFLQQQKTIFIIPIQNLNLLRTQKVGQIWYVSLKQTYEGKTILNSEIELRISPKGKVLAFGWDTYEDVKLTELPILEINEAALSVQEFADKQNLRDIEIEQPEQHFIYADFQNNQWKYRQVYIYKIHGLQTAAHWHLMVDAQTGELIQEHNQLCQIDGTGHSAGLITPELPTDTPIEGVFPHQFINIGDEQISTDEVGNFDFNITEATTLTARMSGPYVNIVNLNGANAFLTQEVLPNEDISLFWNDSNSHLAERNVFVYSNLTHSYLKNIDPDFTGLDYPLNIYVNRNQEPCRAFWDGNNIYYGIGDNSCVNNAYSVAAIYHEYGHAINDKVYEAAGANFGLTNITLHEALADVVFAMNMDEHEFAQGFFGVGTNTRDLELHRSYPQDVIGQQHIDGTILGGAFWDLRKATSIELVNKLSHFAKYGIPDDSDLGLAFGEFFTEVILADDDDGDLGNGTPNFEAINTHFCAHGIGTNLFVGTTFEHTPIENIVAAEAEIIIPFELNLPFETGIETVELVYSTDYFENSTVITATDLSNGQYEAIVPAQSEGTLMKYYIQYSNPTCGGVTKLPFGAIENEHYSFIVGDYVSQQKDDFESDNGWTVGIPSDNATAGIWQRGIPQAVFNQNNILIQPSSDFSENGTRCYVTGAFHGTNWYDHDVDNGKTTLTSPIFEVKAEEHTILQYYKWYINNGGPAPNQDFWQVQISNNTGQTWTNLEYTQSSNRKWNKMQFKIADFVEPTDAMQLRFIAQDDNPGSIVEALIDDVELLKIDESVSTTDVSDFEQVRVYPNPFSEAIMVELLWKKEEGLKNIQVLNVLGQKVDEQSHFFRKGWQKVFLDLERLDSGIYYLVVEKMVIDKILKIN